MHMQRQGEAYAQEMTIVLELYERHAAMIFAYLRKRTCSREDAEDLLEDIFTAALESKNFRELEEQAQVAWLWRVARNKAVDAFRRSTLRRDIPLEHITDTISDDDSTAPEQAALRLDTIKHVEQLLQYLSPEQQEILRLRFGQDLKSVEIAAILGKKETTVRTMLSRTLNFLRNTIKTAERNLDDERA
jgi:RNA polymerase sigma-70 factor (ECF subfamily)